MPPAPDVDRRAEETGCPVRRFVACRNLFGLIRPKRRSRRRPDGFAIVVRSSNRTPHRDRPSFGGIGEPDHRIGGDAFRVGGIGFGSLPSGEARRGRTAPRVQPAGQSGQRRGGEGGGQHPKDQPEVVDPLLALHGDELGGPEALSKHRHFGAEKVHLAGRHGLLGHPTEVGVEPDPLEVFHRDPPHAILILEGPGEVTGLTVVTDRAAVHLAGPGGFGDGEGHCRRLRGRLLRGTTHGWLVRTR